MGSWPKGVLKLMLPCKTESNNGGQTHFAFPIATVHAKQSFQQTSQTRKANCLRGERRGKIAIPLSSNAFEPAAGEGRESEREREGGELRRPGPPSRSMRRRRRKGSSAEESAGGGRGHPVVSALSRCRAPLPSSSRLRRRSRSPARALLSSRTLASTGQRHPPPPSRSVRPRPPASSAPQIRRCTSPAAASTCHRRRGQEPDAHP